MSENKITIEELKLEIEELKYAIRRINSKIESEGGTWGREVDRIMLGIDKINTIMYDPKEGLIVKLDRLSQQSEGRKSVNIGLWVGIGLIIVKEFLDLISK